MYSDHPSTDSVKIEGILRNDSDTNAVYSEFSHQEFNSFVFKNSTERKTADQQAQVNANEIFQSKHQHINNEDDSSAMIEHRQLNRVEDLFPAYKTESGAANGKNQFGPKSIVSDTPKPISSLIERESLSDSPALLELDHKREAHSMGTSFTKSVATNVSQKDQSSSHSQINQSDDASEREQQDIDFWATANEDTKNIVIANRKSTHVTQAGKNPFQFTKSQQEPDLLEMRTQNPAELESMKMESQNYSHSNIGYPNQGKVIHSSIAKTDGYDPASIQAAVGANTDTAKGGWFDSFKFNDGEERKTVSQKTENFNLVSNTHQQEQQHQKKAVTDKKEQQQLLDLSYSQIKQAVDHPQRKSVTLDADTLQQFIQSEVAKSKCFNNVDRSHCFIDATDWIIDFKALEFDKKIGAGGSAEVFKGTWRGIDVGKLRIIVNCSNSS